MDSTYGIARLNSNRFARPQQYWPVIAGIVALFALLPLLFHWMPIWGFLAPILILFAVVFYAYRMQPSAIRRIRMTRQKALPLALFAAGLVLIQLANLAVYEWTLWWPVPIVSTAIIFVAIVVGGRRLDRSWSRTVRTFAD